MKLCWPYVKRRALYQVKWLVQTEVECSAVQVLGCVKLIDVTFPTCPDCCTVQFHVGSELNYLTES